MDMILGIRGTCMVYHIICYANKHILICYTSLSVQRLNFASTVTSSIKTENTVSTSEFINGPTPGIKKLWTETNQRLRQDILACYYHLDLD